MVVGTPPWMGPIKKVPGNERIRIISPRSQNLSAQLQKLAENDQFQCINKSRLNFRKKKSYMM